MEDERLPWTTNYRKLRRLGTGGQGVVYLAERCGTDGFVRPVALKVFSPVPYPDACGYVEDMARVAHIAARASVIQHDNLVDVHNFFAINGIRVMVLEYLDGHDLSEILTQQMLDETRMRVAAERLGILQPRDPDGHPGAAPAQTGDCHPGSAGMPRRIGGAASQRHRPRRFEAVEHHADAHRQRENHRHRLGD